MDQSTYYEYIAAHTGDHQVTGSSQTEKAGDADRAAHRGGKDRSDKGRGGRGRAAGILIGSLAAVAIIAVGVLLGGQFLGPDTGIRSSEPPASEAGRAPTESGSNPTDAERSPDSAPEPGQRLQAIAEEDTTTALDALEGQWVVQLSAKQEGLKTEGMTWTEADILEEFEANKSSYPDALLLWSDDWSTFRFGDYWVTVLAVPYDNADDALAQCREMGIDRDHCFAKKLSTTEGPEESTKLNP